MHVWSKPRRAQALLASIALLAAAVPLGGGIRNASAAGAGAPNQFLVVTPDVSISGSGGTVNVHGCGFAAGGTVEVGNIPVGGASSTFVAGDQQPFSADQSGCINGNYVFPAGTASNSYFLQASDAQRTLYGVTAVNNNFVSPPYVSGNHSLTLSANGGQYVGSSIILPLSSAGTTISIDNATGFEPNGGGTGYALTEYLTSTAAPFTSAPVEAPMTFFTPSTSATGTLNAPLSFSIPASITPGTYFVLLGDNNGQFDVGEITIQGTGTGGPGTGTPLAFNPNPGVTGQTETVTACGFSSSSAASLSNPNLVVTAYNVGSGVTSTLTSITSVSQTPAQASTNCYNYSFSAPAAGTYLFTISNGATTDTGYLTVGAVVTPSPTPSPAPGINTALTFSPTAATPGTTVTASGCNFSATDAALNNFTLVVGGAAIKPTTVFQNLSLGSTCYSFSFTVPQVIPGTYPASASGPNSTATDFGSFTVLGSTCYNGCNTGCNNGNCYPNCTYGCNTGCNTGNCYPNCTYGCNTGCNTGNCYTGCYYCNGYIPGNTGSLIIGTAASLSVVASSVVAGSSATIAGSGFYPGASVTLSSPGLGLSATTLNTSGTFSYTVAVPSTTVSGTYTITATDSTGRTASTTLVVSGARSSSLAASTTSGTVGQQITVTGTGFAAYEQVTLYLNTPGTTQAIAGTVQIYNADANGNFSVTYTVPSTVAGSYYLSALGQSSRTNPYITFNVLNGLYQTGSVTAVQTIQTVQTVQVQPVTQVVQIVSVSQSSTLAAVSTAATTSYFADGYTGTVASNGKATFTVKLYLYNPSNATSSVTTGYAVLDPSSSARTLYSVTDSIPAGATLVRSVNTDVGNNKQVSAMVKATGGIVAEEVITRVGADGSTLDAASTLGSSHLSTNWYFAEGYTGESLQEYITLFNPGGTAANAEIKYMPTEGNAPLAQSVSVPANGQVTVNVRAQYNLLSPNGSKSVGAQVTSDQPIAVDRAMYWGDGDGSGKYGYSLGSGISTPASTQYFAFLPTSDGSQSFVTVLNPSGSSTIVTLNLLSQSGSTVKSVSASVNANARYTFVVPSILAGAGAISGGLVSSQTPVVAEAGLYFGGSPNIGRHPGIVVQGSNGSQVGARANVFSGGGELHIFNPGTSSIRVQVQLGTVSGTSTVSDITLAGQATKVITLTSGTDPQSVLVRGSGFFTAVLVNGGVGSSQAWGGNLN